MGLLSFFPLQTYIKNFNAKVLIETGSGIGTGLKTAQQISALDSIYSCEIDYEQGVYLSSLFKHDRRIKIFSSNSKDYLEKILQFDELKQNKSIIFWLDSHFPSADLNKAGYEDEKDLNIRLPLEIELDLIFKFRPVTECKDIILIDDWRIYEKMNYDGGDLEKMGLKNLTKYNTAFIQKWSTSHKINKYETDTGYIELIPYV